MGGAAIGCDGCNGRNRRGAAIGLPRRHRHSSSLIIHPNLSKVRPIPPVGSFSCARTMDKKTLSSVACSGQEWGAR